MHQNALGQNSVKSILHATLEMPDSNSEGLISLKKRLVSRKHDDLQIEFEKFLNQSLELTACVKFFSAHELWRFVFSQKVTSVSEVWRTESLIWSASNQCLKSTVSNVLSFPFSRCHIRVLTVCIQSKNGFFLENMKHCKFSLNSFWSKFLNEFCQIFFFIRCSRCQNLKLRRFDFSQKAAFLSKAWHTANSVWKAFGANSWDENWRSEEKLPMHSDPQMKMDCGHLNKMGMESVDEIGCWIFINPHKARVFPLL